MKGLLLGSSTKCIRAQILVTGRCGPVDTVLGSASVGSALDTRIILGLYEGYNPRKVT